MNLEMINIKWEIFWVFAFIFIVISFLQINDKKMFLLLAIWSFFYAIHFYYLLLFTAAITNFVDIFKNLAVLKYKKNDYIFWIFLILYITIWIQTENWEFLNYMFILASIISMSAAFYLKWISLRLVYLSSIIMQFIFTVIWNSFSWSLLNLAFIISIFITIFTLYKKQSLREKIKYYRIQVLKSIRKLFWLKYKRYKYI